jgi:hypothetical protein
VSAGVVSASATVGVDDMIDVSNQNFDQAMRASLAKVLRQRGTPEDEIDREVERLRRSRPRFALVSSAVR